MPAFAMHGFGRIPLVIGVLASLTVCVPAPADESPAKVSFTAADGYWIYADYYASTQQYRNGAENDAPIILLLHDCGADRNAWLPLVEPLRRLGAALLVPDLRGHGQSATAETRERAGRADPSLFHEMQSDLRGAYDWLANQHGLDRARFAIIGAGTGAAVALQYAAKDCSVDVVVCLSPPWDQPGLNPAGDMRQVRGRKVLLVAGPAEEEICKTLGERTKGVEVRSCRAAGRGCELLSTEPKLCDEIVRFASSGMGRPSTALVCGSIERNIYHALGSAWVAKINPTNLRYYSSPEEAESRGLRAARSTGPEQRGRDRQRRRP
jgi:pimeloyl-ACP methyl ester carboxylesterase